MKVKLSTIKSNPNNPRLIKDAKFEKLKKSISEFPKMMELRPMVINADSVILGGNMRFKALKDLGYKEVPEEWIKRAEDLTDEEARRFIIADNVGFGEHDWEVLANEWDTQELEDWGLEGFPFESDESESEPKDLSDDLKETFEVIVECSDEMEQIEVYEKLTKENKYICRVLTL